MIIELAQFPRAERNRIKYQFGFWEISICLFIHFIDQSNLINDKIIASFIQKIKLQLVMVNSEKVFIALMFLWLHIWCFDVPWASSPDPDQTDLHITQCKTTQLFWWDIFHWDVLSPARPSALLCQTCAALLKCWIINVHKHFKRWGAIAPRLACWRCVRWGYCFRQGGGKHRPVLGERSAGGKKSDDLPSVFTPRTNTSGEHLRTLVKADLC